MLKTLIVFFLSTLLRYFVIYKTRSSVHLKELSLFMLILTTPPIRDLQPPKLRSTRNEKSEKKEEKLITFSSSPHPPPSTALHKLLIGFLLLTPNSQQRSSSSHPPRMISSQLCCFHPIAYLRSASERWWSELRQREEKFRSTIRKCWKKFLGAARMFVESVWASPTPNPIIHIQKEQQKTETVNHHRSWFAPLLTRPYYSYQKHAHGLLKPEWAQEIDGSVFHLLWIYYFALHAASRYSSSTA